MWDRKITLGNVVTIITVLVGMGISWGQSSARIDGLEKNNNRLEKLLESNERAVNKLTLEVIQLQMEIAYSKRENK